jgi:tRNA1(Val) A37 N6-methylase TrmN6
MPQREPMAEKPIDSGLVATSTDAFLDGRLMLRQPLKGHRIGTDALLLAAVTPPIGRVCDLGSGVGLVGLALGLAGATGVVLVEREAVFAACARINAEKAGLGAHVNVAEVDVFDRRAILADPRLADQSFDAVATNPPYDQALRGRRTPNALKLAAHAMAGGNLTNWLACAVRLLKDGGVLTLIHRADKLADVLAALPRRAGSVAIRPVLPRDGEGATRILVSAIAGSRAPLSILPPLILHDAVGQFTPEARQIHEGRAALARAPGPMISLR